MHVGAEQEVAGLRSDIHRCLTHSLRARPLLKSAQQIRCEMAKSHHTSTFLHGNEVLTTRDTDGEGATQPLNTSL